MSDDARERATGRTAEPVSDEPVGPSRFRTNLVRVMAVQVVTLVLLWLLQRHFST